MDAVRRAIRCRKSSKCNKSFVLQNRKGIGDLAACTVAGCVMRDLQLMTARIQGRGTGLAGFGAPTTSIRTFVVVSPGKYLSP